MRVLCVTQIEGRIEAIKKKLHRYKFKWWNLLSALDKAGKLLKTLESIIDNCIDQMQNSIKSLNINELVKVTGIF